MKKTFLISVLSLLLGCNQEQRQVDTWNRRIKEFKEKALEELKSKHPEILKTVKEFSLNYLPKGSASLDSIPADILKAFTELRMIDRDAHQKYVTLVFSKLYAEHLKCCHQSYIIGSFRKNEFNFDKPSMLNEFAYMTGYLDRQNLPEIWTSGIVDKWLTENPELLKFKPIGECYQQIRKISKNIEDGYYWEK